MTMASGTWGTIQWSISDDGALTLGAGVQPQTPIINTKEAYPWHGYRQSITSVRFTGSISSRRAYIGTADSTAWSSAFSDCQALTSVSGLSYISNAVNTTSMFFGCSSLTSIDLSSFDTSKLEYITFMFMNCTVLTSVEFGAYGFGSLNTSYSDRLYLIDSNYKTAECNGIVVSSDKQFLALEKTEQAGTWTRKATASSISCTARRTANGTAREDGDDVTFTFTWVFAEGATSAPVRIYQKAAGDPSYPSTPTSSLTLSGNAGNTTYTIAGIGDAAYDYRVEIVDGSSTYVFFPAVTANIRLMDFDENGNAHVYGGLTADGDVTDGSGNVLSDKADVADMPTKTSDLTNDSGYITSSKAASTYLPLAGGVITGGLSVTGAQIVQSWAGVIQMFGGSTPPAGWLLCDGRAVSRTTYPTLFSAIGTTWGPGDGSTTFNLPDLRGRFAVGSFPNMPGNWEPLDDPMMLYGDTYNLLWTDGAYHMEMREKYLAYKLGHNGRVTVGNTYILQLENVNIRRDSDKGSATTSTIGLGIYLGAGGTVNHLVNVLGSETNDGITALKSWTGVDGNIYAHADKLTITLNTTSKTKGDDYLWIYNSTGTGFRDPTATAGEMTIGRYMLTESSIGAIPWEPRKFFDRGWNPYKVGRIGGREGESLSVVQMPNHTHSTPNHTHTFTGNRDAGEAISGSNPSPRGDFMRMGSGSTWTITNNTGGGTSGSTGMSNTFDIRPPFAVVSYIIHTGKVS